MSKLMLIDGNSIMNRAFYGTQNSFMKNAEGLFTGALYGFLGIMVKYLEEESPDYLAVAFDLHAPTFRHKEYDGYKATRHGMPVELQAQMPIIKELLDSMNIARLEIEGYEADDIIGTYAKRAQQNGIDTVIVTGDRDSFQLISSKITVKLPVTKQGSTTTEMYDIEAIKDKYGVSPVQLIEVKALMGDTSDNIPGVPGVGEKTALQLISQYESLDNVYSNLNNITKPSLHSKLEEHKDLAYLSRKLAEIYCEVPLDMQFDEIKLEKPNESKLRELLTKLEFKNFIKKFNLQNVTNTPVIKEPSLFDEIIPETKNTQYKYIMTEEELNEMPDFEDCKQLFIYCIWQSDSLDEMLILPEHSDVTYSIMLSDPMFATLFVSKYKQIFENSNVSKIMYDAKPFILWLENYQCNFVGLVCDVAISAYILDGARKNSGIDDVYRYFTGREIEDIKPCVALSHIYPIAMKAITENKQEFLYNDIEIPLIYVLADLEYQGFRVDPEVLKVEGAQLEGRLSELTENIFELAGRPFNINSPKQLGEVLFDELGLQSKKKTKGGQKTTGQNVLEELADQHPIISMISEYRQNAKLKSTYIDGLLGVINPKTGRVHSSFNQMITATGRLSSTEPNLQNIPIRHELGRRIRKAFIPTDSNHILIDADYSQIELRILAHISGDEAMISAFKEDMDIHTLTASQVNNIPFDMVTKEMRGKAKAVNFGIVYGISEFGLAQDTGMMRFEAKKYIEEYFKKYPDVKVYLNDIVAFAHSHGYVETIFGRRRYLPELTSAKHTVKAFGERVAMNMPIQGSAADIIKIAMNKVYEALKKGGYKSKLILQVHDELLIDAVKSEETEVRQILKDCMENACPLSVPLSVSLASGRNWYEAK